MFQPKLTRDREDILACFNASLLELKELFHKTGRFDDANAKLDEIMKLLTIKYIDLRDRSSHLSVDTLRLLARKKFGDATHIARALQIVFEEIAKNSLFQNGDGTNIFGANPHLNLQPTDDALAERIIQAVNRIAPKNIGVNFDNIDLLNEAFGHFVRDNFRNHKEDAQYMTPIEVVDAMLDIVLKDIADDPVVINSLSRRDGAFVVLDPTCGVGTFLVRTAQKIQAMIENPNVRHGGNIASIKHGSYFGQDKVDRMVRMAKLNCLFSGLDPDLITQGNSVVGESAINALRGKVDLIVTNPPFGAEFTFEEIDADRENFEIFPEIRKEFKIRALNSELLLLDRSLNLLKPGGRLLIIVPDGVVSSGGIYEEYRRRLSNRFILKGVVDLPAVTFAQAGTRTKCSIIYIQKPLTMSRPEHGPVFMAVAEEIGYEVKERMGSPVKTISGSNDLQEIARQYKTAKRGGGVKVLSKEPSVVIYPFQSLINNKWNAHFYHASRIGAINKFNAIDADEFEVLKLQEIAEFCTKNRERVFASKDIKHISVLHVNDDSTIRLDDVLEYRPTCPGIECAPGEIIFSKINPRIPRVAVVPNVGLRLTCSSEFEVMKPRDIKFTYLLKTLLLTDAVQNQIKSLTSGTSSSHNRIKSAELRDILIVWPRKGTGSEKNLIKLSSEIENEEQRKYQSSSAIKSAFDQINALVAV